MHNLLADLNVTQQEFDARAAADPRLSRLVERYQEADAKVVAAERDYSDDEVVTGLKMERLQLKDEIVAHLRG
ncbi:DUF465 domain-containing protein [Nocardia sp. NPDC050435]|uniref:YdcH family protein n=1 Tax=Nocardia sp. NPDC050435 TaxID=3155040 RepID=UPI0033D5B0B9